MSTGFGNQSVPKRVFRNEDHFVSARRLVQFDLSVQNFLRLLPRARTQTHTHTHAYMDTYTRSFFSFFFFKICFGKFKDARLEVSYGCWERMYLHVAVSTSTISFCHFTQFVSFSFRNIFEERYSVDELFERLPINFIQGVRKRTTASLVVYVSGNDGRRR